MPKLKFIQKFRNKTFAALEREAENLFPKSGVWHTEDLNQVTDSDMMYLPNHFNDNQWVSKILQKKLRQKLILVPSKTVKFFVENSHKFAQLKHNYALEIVKWETNYIMRDGDNKQAPKNYDDLMMATVVDWVQVVRDGVVDALTTLGIDRATIEEGLEKNADNWRNHCLERSFRNLYEPSKFIPNVPQHLQPVKPEHRKNWLAAQEYLYYQKHAESVEKYGQLTPAMKMSREEYNDLVQVLEEQNQARSEEIKSWQYAKNYTECLLGRNLR